MTALLFPGQGAQKVGMGRDFYEKYLAARELFQEADERLGMALSQIIFEGPQELLRETVNCQLAIYVTSLAIDRVVRHELPEVRMGSCAGHSLGEYTALTASGRLSLEDGLELVRQRGELMQRGCKDHPGTMAAVVGLSAQELEQRLQGLLGKGVWLANVNAPDQVVLSGTKQGVEAACEAIRAAGGAKVVPLEVAGAFHSPLMAAAAEQLAELIERVTLQEQTVPIVMNRSGKAFAKSDQIRQQMLEQMPSPVQWVETLRTMGQMGTSVWLELGPGRVLSGLGRRNSVVGRQLNVEKVTDLDQLHEALCQVS